MILTSPSLTSLAIALFASTVASHPLEGGVPCAKRGEENNDALVSIRYPNGDVRPIVDNVWFKGIECAKSDPTGILHECLYHRACFGPRDPVISGCIGLKKSSVYDHSDITRSLACAFDALCKSDTKPSPQSQEDQEREKASGTMETRCRDTVKYFENVTYNECAFKRAAELGRTGPYADVYNAGKADFCFDIKRNTKTYPDDCVLWHVENLDKANPPPTKDGVESVKPPQQSSEDQEKEKTKDSTLPFAPTTNINSEKNKNASLAATAESDKDKPENDKSENNKPENNKPENDNSENDKSSTPFETAPVEDRKTENGVASIRYPSGDVRPLVDNFWYEGVECAKYDSMVNIPHECIYRRVCHGISVSPLFPCSASSDYLQQAVYDRSELVSPYTCAYAMFCKRDTKPQQQSPEDQEKEKTKDSTLPFAPTTNINSEKNKNASLAATAESDKDKSENNKPENDKSENDKSSKPFETAPAEDRKTENGVASIRYPSGDVRPLVDNFWYEGVECAKYDSMVNIPHECIYRRVCHGVSVSPLFPCSASSDYLQQAVYDRSELVSPYTCAYAMFCKRDTKPQQQSPEDQEKEKTKDSTLPFAPTTNINSEKNKNASLAATAESDKDKSKKDQYKNQLDDEGIPCSAYSDVNTVAEVPEECLKPVFCNFNYSSNKMLCRDVNLRAETVNKTELVQKVKIMDCVQGSICRREDIYNLPDESA